MESKTTHDPSHHLDLSEWDRIAKLSQKLVHSLGDVRQRAARNLLSKFQRGIYQHSAFPAALCRQLIVNINDSLCLLSALDADTMSQQDTDCLRDTLRLVSCLFASTNAFLLDISGSPHKSSTRSKSDPTVILLDNLYSLQKAKSILHGESLIDILNQVITLIDLCIIFIVS